MTSLTSVSDANNELQFSHKTSADIEMEICFKLDRLIVFNILKNLELSALKKQLKNVHFRGQIVTHGIKLHSACAVSGIGKISASISELDTLEDNEFMHLKSNLKSNMFEIIFNDWMQFPVRYKELEKESKLNLDLYSGENVISQLSIKIFSESSKFEIPILIQGKVSAMLAKIPNDSKVISVSSFVDSVEDNAEWIHIFRSTSTVEDVLDHYVNVLSTSRNDFELMLKFETLELNVPVLFSAKASNKSDVPLINSIDEKIYNLFNRLEIEDTAPSEHEMKELDSIITKFSSKVIAKLSIYEANLVWKFQAHILGKKEFLLPYLCCVNFDNQFEISQFKRVMKNWTLGVHQLIILSSYFYNIPPIFRLVLERFELVNDEDLLAFLQPLVQALKYEPHYETTFPEIGDLTVFLVNRATMNFEIASYLMWYLEVEVFRPNNNVYKNIQQYFYYTLQHCEKKNLFLQLDLEKQAVRKILSLIPLLETFNEKAYKREERLKLILETYPQYIELSRFPYPIPLPIYPSMNFVKVKSNTAKVIQSNAYPIVLDLVLDKDSLLKRIMFKKGDELSQDSLIVSLIKLMNEILLKANIQLYMITYKVLPTGHKEGLIEFVNKAYPISKILDKYGSIISFFHHFSKKANSSNTSAEKASKLYVENSKLERFIKSCAGFCVISYLLGIGDRHLDNIMVKHSGELFHIDFGYVLGKDPKSFAPEIRLTKEMIETMGGRSSGGYKTFKKQCSAAYLELRRHWHLFLSIIHLMRSASIPDINETQAYEKVVTTMRTKFRLEVTEEKASEELLHLIDSNAEALVPVLYDMIHRAAVAIK